LIHRLQRTAEEVAGEIAASECELDARSLRLWERVRIAPAPWAQHQYPGGEPFWVVAILGNRCLYLNDVEGGWGWGRFSEWGFVGEYHWQQDDIHHAVGQTLFAIDHGGAG
jgi:hypothetical protein